MEKNGAINSNTPGGCCGGGCHSEKQAQHTQLRLFPENSQEADAMEGDLTKKAIDMVQEQSKKSE
jgi:hypothetical protein